MPLAATATGCRAWSTIRAMRSRSSASTAAASGCSCTTACAACTSMAGRCGAWRCCAPAMRSTSMAWSCCCWATSRKRATAADAGRYQQDPRMVLRGVGGQHHGRCFSLDQPRRVGRAADCRHPHRRAGVRRAPRGDRAAWRRRGAARAWAPARGSLVNGYPVRDALAAAGRPGRVRCPAPLRGGVAENAVGRRRTIRPKSMTPKTLPTVSGARTARGATAFVGPPHALAAAGGADAGRGAQPAAAVRRTLSARSFFHSRQPSNTARIAAYSSGSRMSDFTSHQKCSTASTPIT